MSQEVLLLQKILYSLEGKAIPRLGYNFTVCNSKKFVWFRVAKVATRSIFEVLKKNVEISKHTHWKIFDEKKYNDYFKFAFVRNPWDRLVSCYYDKVLKKKLFKKCWDKDFSYFVNYVKKQNLEKADRHLRLQSSLFPPDEIDFIGRFENLEEDFHYICEKIGLSNIKLPHENITRHKHYTKYYNNETRAIVAEIYAKDIKNFGYKFDS